MNWLAHVFLSEPDVEFRLGNLLADIVRGEELRRMSPAFQRGVDKHKQIDAFTDAHPVVKRSRARISTRFRRFSGVLVDVFYDHLLASDWDRYSPIVLDAFTARFYADIEARHIELPASARVTASATVFWIARSGSVYSAGAGMTPSKYFSIMATVREARLPKPLASSAW